MKKPDLPIPVHQIAFLQAYLYQIFTIDNQCKKSFKNTEWYLKENYKKQEVDSIINFFKNNNLKCDCDVINKLDLKEISHGLIKAHK